MSPGLRSRLDLPRDPETGKSAGEEGPRGDSAWRGCVVFGVLPGRRRTATLFMTGSFLFAAATGGSRGTSGGWTSSPAWRIRGPTKDPHPLLSVTRTRRGCRGEGHWPYVSACTDSLLDGPCVSCARITAGHPGAAPRTTSPKATTDSCIRTQAGTPAPKHGQPPQLLRRGRVS